ncbi:unnamed protein product [Prunus armeniaca]
MGPVQRCAQLALQFRHADMRPNSHIVEKRNILLVVVTLVSATLYSGGINPPGLQHCKCITPVWNVKNCGCSALTLLSVLFISLALMLSGIMLIILVGRNPFAPLVYLLLMGAAIPYWFTLATFLHPLLWFAFMVVCWLPSCYALFLFRRFVTGADAAVPAAPAPAVGGGEIVADGGEIV